MEPISGLLLDTHIVIWMANEPSRIPRRMLKAIEEGKRRFVSLTSVHEIQVKHQRDPVDFGFSLRHLEQTMKEFACMELPVSFEDLRKLDEMQFLHKDPFDRLLMAQVAKRGLELVTVDKDILRTFQRFKEFRVFK